MLRAVMANALLTEIPAVMAFPFSQHMMLSAGIGFNAVILSIIVIKELTVCLDLPRDGRYMPGQTNCYLGQVISLGQILFDQGTVSQGKVVTHDYPFRPDG